MSNGVISETLETWSGLTVCCCSMVRIVGKSVSTKIINSFGLRYSTDSFVRCRCGEKLAWFTPTSGIQSARQGDNERTQSPASS